MGDQDRLMTEAEAARWLRIAPRTLRAYRAAGTGPAVAGFVGRSPRYRVADLESWLRRERRS